MHSMNSLTSAQVHSWGGADEGRDSPTSRVSVGGAVIEIRTFALLVSSCTVDAEEEEWEEVGGGEATGNRRLA